LTSTDRRRGAGVLLSVLALVLGLLAGGVLAQTPPTPPAGGAKAPDHSAHDRTKVPKPQRAEDMVKHGEELRKQMDDLANPANPCPKTPQEWEDVFNAYAQWKAYQEVRGAMKAEFGDQLNNTPLGQRYDKVFDGKKGLGKALEARLQACNPPANVVKTPQQILETIAHFVDVERGLAGLIALAVTDCPDCKREQQRVNTPGPSTPASGGGK